MLMEDSQRVADIIQKWEKAEDIALISLSFSDAGEKAEYLVHQPGGKPDSLRRDVGRLHWIIEELREELHLFSGENYILIHRSKHRPVYVIDYRGGWGKLQRFVVPRSA